MKLKQKGFNLENAFLNTAPAQYLNQKGVIDSCGSYISQWGTKAIISGGKRATAALKGSLFDTLKGNEIDFTHHQFEGECCDENIHLLSEKTKAFDADLFIAVGGGKSMDTGKAAAGICGVPFITIPTIAATCAATTTLVVKYTQEGTFNGFMFLPTNPNLVVVDPQIIAKAPSEYLRSGVLDSLAKWFEGKTVLKGLKDTDIFSTYAMKWAETLFNEIKQNGKKAIDLVEKQKVGDELVRIVDTVVYFTGVIQSLVLGKIRGGLAHPIGNGIAWANGGHDVLHGVSVGYGIIVQLIVEGAELDEIKETVSLFRSLGMEPTLAGLNLPNDDETMSLIAEKVLVNSYTGVFPFKLDHDILVSAMRKLENGIEHFQ